METRFEHALDKLKMFGVRMTPQRYAILEYMVDSMNHPTADDIYKALCHRFPNMSVATVYNNLKLFIEAGLVRELTYGDDSSRYDANISDHYHVICTQCSTIVDFDYPKLEFIEDEAMKKTAFLIHGHRLEVYGLCPNCASHVRH
jgi:Fur family peroxide stress response transcriptional regulator